MFPCDILAEFNHQEQKYILQRSLEELLMAWGRAVEGCPSFWLTPSLNTALLSFWSFLGSLALPTQGARKAQSPASFLGPPKSLITVSIMGHMSLLGKHSVG